MNKLTYNEALELAQKYLNKTVLIRTKKNIEKGIMLGHFSDEESIVIDKGTYTLGIPMRDIIEIICLEDEKQQQ